MAIPAAILPWIEARFFLTTGAPNALGTLTFYAAGTSTLQDTYANVGLTVANPNPLTLDSGGRPTVAIYLQPLAYKVVVKDSGGATLYTYDNVSADAYNYFALLGQSLSAGAKDVVSGYTVTSDDVFITVDEPSITPAIINLPAASGRGQPVIVQNRSAAGVTAQLTPTNPDTINGQPNFSLPAASGAVYPTALLLPYLASGYFVIAGWGL